MTYHEKLYIPGTFEIFLCGKGNAFYEVLFIHYELWLFRENKTEINNCEILPRNLN